MSSMPRGVLPANQPAAQAHLAHAFSSFAAPSPRNSIEMRARLLRTQAIASGRPCALGTAVHLCRYIQLNSSCGLRHEWYRYAMKQEDVYHLGKSR